MLGLFKNKQNEITGYFKNGILFNVTPAEKKNDYYDLKFVVIDGKKFNLEKEKDITNLSVPNFDYFDSSPYGVTGNLVYVLRMKASSLKTNGKFDLSLLLLKKATEMMPVSKVGWSKKDYMRFADWLFEMGEPKEALKAVKSIESLFNQMDFNKQLYNKNLEDAETLDTDHVEANYRFGCCAECAKYRGRIFSVSGKDKRFSKMPKQNYGCTCQGLAFSPFILGISEPSISDILGYKVDIINYSNRPFIDDRTVEEKYAYDMYRKEQDIEVWYEPYRRRLLAIKGNSKKQYAWVCEQLPDIAPKSMGGFTRMKNSNSKNFQILVKKAQEKGMNITYTDEERAEIEQLKPFQEKYAEIKAECLAYYQSQKR